MFYHNGKLTGGGGYKRSTCVEEFTPNEDGSIPYISFTTKGVSPLQTLNPFDLQEAETINQCAGVICEGDYRRCYVTDIEQGDFIKVRNVDFGKAGATSVTAKVRSDKACTILVRLKAKTNSAKGRIEITPTNGEWQEFTCDLTSPITGVNDLFFTFTGTGKSLLDFDSWQFAENPTGIVDAQRLKNKGEKEDVYDLQGRKVSTTTSPGLYIVNGKKRVL